MRTLTHVGSGRANHAQTEDRKVGFAAVLRIRAFAILYTAEIQSLIGDQIARVALSILVFDATGSAAATAATYAATFLPALLGGVLLTSLGDRFPRRDVMMVCEVVRVACFAAMAVPGIDLWLVIGLLVVAVLVAPVFSAAQVGYLAAELEPEAYRTATALRMMSSQTAQTFGFALGGLLVAVLDPHLALLIDAATYAVSALLVLSLRGRRSASTAPAVPVRRPSPVPGLWVDRRLRLLVALVVLYGFYAVPEGLAVPFGASVGSTTIQIGLLLASGSLGAAVGAAVLVHAVPQRRRAVAVEVMAVGCGLPLVVPAFWPHWEVAAVCWFVSGALSAYLIEAMTEIIQAIPDSRRAHQGGIVAALLLAGQGLGQLGFGALAAVVAPGTAIAVAGGAGAVLTGVVVRRRRSTPSPAVTVARHQARMRPSTGVPIVRPSAVMTRIGADNAANTASTLGSR